MGITVNPLQTTVAAGTFNVQTEGYIQGTALQDPSVRNELAGGIWNGSAPGWGGMAISEVATPVSSSPSAPNRALGGYITGAVNVTGGGAAGGITGWSVYDQVHSAITTPQSPAPLIPQGGMINFYRLGSNARIPVAVDPALISLGGEIINTPVSWDYYGQQLVPYVAAYNEAAYVSAAYTSSTGLLAITFGSAPTPVAGDVVNIVTVVTGNAAASAALTGSFVVTNIATDVMTVQAPLGLGSLSIASGQLNAGGGAAPCRVLEVVPENCMTVLFNPLTNNANWNRNGACAVILI